MFHNDERKEYTPFENLEKSAQENIKTLEKKLTYKDFLNGKIISIADVETYDSFILLNVNLSKEEYPHINKWKKEIERMKLNWKISKKPIQIKGRTFNEYVKLQSEKLEIQDKKFSNKMKELTNISKNILKDNNSEKNKEIATIHFFKKIENQQFKIKILIKFIPGQNIKYQDIASKIMIISHNYFKYKTICEEGKGDINNGISAILSSIIDKNEYDIENFANDIKRNIQGVLTLTILGIDKIEENNDKNKENEKENEVNFKNNIVNLQKDIQIKNNDDNK
jgi:hypothetical protein